MKDWWIYQGSGDAAQRLERLSHTVPPWRRFKGLSDPSHRADLSGDAWEETQLRGGGYAAEPAEIDAVNTALYLRRPLLVTGNPGVGKSTLAYSIAADLNLGPVLRWPISSRSSIRDGLYHYDAIGRLHDANLSTMAGAPRSQRHRVGRPARAASGPGSSSSRTTSIAPYLRLGPLGTALLPRDQPRVLLVDEIDKGDIDLPGDLLTVFEEGYFEIPELARVATHQPRIRIGTEDSPDPRARIDQGRVECSAFPIIILTSNGERDFPPPLLRRCIRLRIEAPSRRKLEDIVRHRLGVAPTDEPCRGLIEDYLSRRADGELATDQLLNAIQLRLSGAWPDLADRQQLLATTLQQLNTTYYP